MYLVGVTTLSFLLRVLIILNILLGGFWVFLGEKNVNAGGIFVSFLNEKKSLGGKIKAETPYWPGLIIES